MLEISNVKSQTIPSFIYKSENTMGDTVQEPSLEWFNDEFKLSHVSVIMGVVIIIQLLIIIFCFCRFKSCKSSSLSLELTSGGDCVVIPLLHLSLCPSYYQISPPVIDDVSISAFSSSKLFLSWAKFTVTDKRTNKIVNVPSTISLSWVTYYRVKKILKQPFSAYTLLVHQNDAYVLNDLVNFGLLNDIVHE